MTDEKAQEWGAALDTWLADDEQARLALHCVLKQILRANCRAPLWLPLPPSHCSATTADRTVTSHCLFNTPHAVVGLLAAAARSENGSGSGRSGCRGAA